MGYGCTIIFIDIQFMTKCIQIATCLHRLPGAEYLRNNTLPGSLIGLRSTLQYIQSQGKFPVTSIEREPLSSSSRRSLYHRWMCVRRWLRGWAELEPQCDCTRLWPQYWESDIGRSRASVHRQGSAFESRRDTQCTALVSNGSPISTGTCKFICM